MDTVPTSQNRSQWNNIYTIGGYAALLSFALTLFDIIFGSVTGANLTSLPPTALARFAEFQQSWPLGLYHLDFLNSLNALIMIPAYFAAAAVHRQTSPAWAALALVLVLMGAALFVSNNSALSMLELSQKYYAAADESQKQLITAAGEALLASGEHGSLGAFPGFILSTLASLTMAMVMLKGSIFGRKASWCGVIGNILLGMYIILVTFVPQVASIAVAVAAPGGLLALAWIFLMGIQLIKMGATEDLYYIGPLRGA